MVRPKSFLDELSGPFIPSSDLEPSSVTIGTELPKLLKVMIEKLNQNQSERLMVFSFRMNRRQLKNRYKNNHPEEFRRWVELQLESSLECLGSLLMY